jgi:hypothetical protein
LSLNGTLSVEIDETTGTWTFDSLYAATAAPNEYTLRFSNHWLAYVDQIIRVTQGVIGYKLMIVIPDISAETYALKQSITFASSNVNVVDAG